MKAGAQWGCGGWGLFPGAAFRVKPPCLPQVGASAARFMGEALLVEAVGSGCALG